jgi:hypothetical protein
MEHTDVCDITKRPNQQIMDIEEGKEIPRKYVNDLFNNIIAENTPILRKRGTSRNRRLTECQAITPRKKHSQTYSNQNT